MLKKTLLRVTIAGALAFGIAGIANASNTTGPYIGGQIGWADTHNSVGELPGSPSVTEIASGISQGGILGDWDSFTGGSSINNDNIAGRLFAGYQFSPYFAGELGYAKFHNANVNGNYAGATNSSVTFDQFGDTYSQSENGTYSYRSLIKEQAFDLAGKGILPLQQGFSVYAKLGVAYVMQSIKRNDTETDAGNMQFSGPYLNSSTSFTTGTLGQSYSQNSNAFMPEGALGVSYDVTPNIPVDLSWTHIQKVNGNIANIDMIALGAAYKFND